jgi:YD repeat-containing protein
MQTSYDQNGNRASVVDQLGRTTSYSYDRLDRLTNVDYSDTEHFQPEPSPPHPVSRVVRGRFWTSRHGTIRPPHPPTVCPGVLRTFQMTRTLRPSQPV